MSTDLSALFGVSVAELYVSSGGITHRRTCSHFRPRLRWDDSDRRDLLGHVWCSRCCPDLAPHRCAAGLDRPPTHRAGCTGGTMAPVAVQAMDDRHDGASLALLACTACRAQMYLFIAGAVS